MQLEKILSFHCYSWDLPTQLSHVRLKEFTLEKKYGKGLYHLHVGSNCKTLTTTNCESQTNQPGTGKTLRWFSLSSYFLSCNKLVFRYLEKGNMSSFNTPKLQYCKGGWMQCSSPEDTAFLRCLLANGTLKILILKMHFLSLFFFFSLYLYSYYISMKYYNYKSDLWHSFPFIWH